MADNLETKLAKLCETLERNRAKAEAERREKEDKKLARLRPWWTQAAQWRPILLPLAKVEGSKRDGTTPVQNEQMTRKHEEKQAFETWVFDGIRYLAIQLDNRVHIISQTGSNFGSWFDVQSFRKRQQTQTPQEWMALGVATLMPPVPL